VPSHSSPGVRETAGLIWGVGLLFMACAHGGPPPRDATRDPEFQQALREARPDFPNQRDALAAGLYEPFVHPDSLPPASPGQVVPESSARGFDRGPLASSEATGRTPPAAGGRQGGPAVDYSEDPTTQELLSSLPGAGEDVARQGASADRKTGAMQGRVGAGDAGDRAELQRPSAAAASGGWTLQLGAFTSDRAARLKADQARGAAPEHPVLVVDAGSLTRVFLGRFATKAEAETALRRLAGRPGIGAAWVTRAGP
jgi:cell division septation protein DedD